VENFLDFLLFLQGILLKSGYESTTRFIPKGLNVRGEFINSVNEVLELSMKNWPEENTRSSFSKWGVHGIDWIRANFLC
jgi:hypothetical protein